MPEYPLVSVVIPTVNRPQLICRALKSALGQTFQNLEVVVVVDGPDVATVRELAKVDDPRLRLFILDRPGGGAKARNQGVKCARGEWVAFLDDDDEWLPRKLESQLEIALNADCPDPIVSSRFIAKTPTGDYVWPRKILGEKQPISEYLLVRRGLSRSEGFIATPTIFARKSLLEHVPFKPELKRHQDWDWVLRATLLPSVKVFFSEEALVICHMNDPNSVSRNADWNFSWTWIRAMKSQITRRAYASFVLCHVGWQAAAQHAWRAFLPLLTDAVRSGPLSFVDVMRYAGFWLLPTAIRRRLLAWVS